MTSFTASGRHCHKSFCHSTTPIYGRARTLRLKICRKATVRLQAKSHTLCVDAVIVVQCHVLRARYARQARRYLHKDKDDERSGTLWWYSFLVHSMERSGAAFIKLGQWAASRQDIFPVQMCSIMSSLHSNAPSAQLQTQRLERADVIL